MTPKLKALIKAEKDAAPLMAVPTRDKSVKFPNNDLLQLKLPPLLQNMSHVQLRRIARSRGMHVTMTEDKADLLLRIREEEADAEYKRAELLNYKPEDLREIIEVWEAVPTGTNLLKLRKSELVTIILEAQKEDT